MEYHYVPYDLNHYATDLQKDPKSNHLDWDSSPGQNALIVQTPYGVKATDVEEEITGSSLPIIQVLCEKLPGMDWNEEEFTEIFPSVWVRFVTAASKVRMKGCPLHGEASTYSVFAYERSGDVFTIFTPRDQAMISPFCDVPVDVHVEIKKEKRVVKKLFRTIEEESGFYVLSFPDPVVDGYKDGTISVVVNGMDIPVTKTMLTVGNVYIKTNVRPELKTKNKGLHIM